MSILSMTLLPPPDAPMMVMVSPRLMVRFKPEKITFGPNRLCTSEKRMRSPPIGVLGALVIPMPSAGG